jgi:hypothetical protein
VPPELAELFDEEAANARVGRIEKGLPVGDAVPIDAGAPKGRLPRQRHQGGVPAVNPLCRALSRAGAASSDGVAMTALGAPKAA